MTRQTVTAGQLTYPQAIALLRNRAMELRGLINPTLADEEAGWEIQLCLGDLLNDFTIMDSPEETCRELVELGLLRRRPGFGYPATQAGRRWVAECVACAAAIRGVLGALDLAALGHGKLGERRPWNLVPPGTMVRNRYGEIAHRFATDSGRQGRWVYCGEHPRAGKRWSTENWCFGWTSWGALPWEEFEIVGTQVPDGADADTLRAIAAQSSCSVEKTVS